MAVACSTAVDYIIKSFAAIASPCVLEPNLNDPRREVELTAQSVNLVPLRPRLHSKIILQNLSNR